MIAELLVKRRSIRNFKKTDLPLEAINRLIWAAQGKSDNCGNRTAPSAHALHPLRLMLAVGRVQGLDAGLYSIDPVIHQLQRVHRGDVRKKLEAAAVGEQPWVGDAACVVSICADFVAPSKDFAAQQPFGRRGSRYVYIEAGAAAQNLHLQATEDGIGAVLVAGFNDEKTSEALELNAPIAPNMHMCIGRS